MRAKRRILRCPRFTEGTGRDRFRLTIQLERYPQNGEARIHSAVTRTGIGSASDDVLVAAMSIAD
jgi:hypothetical protein